jgi:hypothetical protein
MMGVAARTARPDDSKLEGIGRTFRALTDYCDSQNKNPKNYPPFVGFCLFSVCLMSCDFLPVVVGF